MIVMAYCSGIISDFVIFILVYLQITEPGLPISHLILQRSQRQLVLLHQFSLNSQNIAILLPLSTSFSSPTLSCRLSIICCSF